MLSEIGPFSSSQDEGLSRSDTDNTELDVHQCDVYQSEVGHRSSTICDSPLSRQPQQSAQLDSEKESLRAKVGSEVLVMLDHAKILLGACWVCCCRYVSRRHVSKTTSAAAEIFRQKWMQ